jgi:SAM-dependent methyltransferase
MITIANYSHDLQCQDGIWQAAVAEKISYPADGNNSCFDIEDQSFWFKYRNSVICETIKKYAIGGPVFDVGGGNGYVANYLCDNGFETVLVEPGMDGCFNGRKRGLENIVNAIFDTAHFYSNSIPNIGIFDVLEHIGNPDKFLNTLHTMLIANGRLFVTVPAYNGLWSEEDKQAGHYRRYRITELRKLLNDQGFDIPYATYFFSFLVLPIFLFRTIPSKFGFHKIDSQKFKKQHSQNSATSAFLAVTMKFELEKIKKSKSLPFGSSLLIVAKKR